MKKLIIPDLHIGLVYDGLDRTDDVFQILETIYKNEYNDLTEVVWLGDIFDHPNVSHSYVAEFIKVLNKFYANSFCKHTILLGNHDGQNTTRKGSPLEEVEASGIAKVIWEPTLEKNTLYLPYTIHPEKMEQFKLGSYDVTYTHLDIPNAVKGLENEIGKGITSWLPNFIIKNSKQIYAGHIHKPQLLGNIDVIGSLLTVNMSETEDIKRYVRQIDNQDQYVSIQQRKLIHFNLDITSENEYNKFEEIKKADIDNSILSVKGFCQHNLVHKYDLKGFESELRNRVKHLRFNIDVVKEKKLRMKHLDAKKSDFSIIDDYITSQGITDKESILNKVKELL